MAKLTYEQIQDYINGEHGNGCVLLITKEEFEEEKVKQNKNNSIVKLKIICKCGNIFSTTFNSFKVSSKKQCNICGLEKVRIARRTSGDIVYQSFIDNGFTPLFKSEDYKNNSQRLPYICNKHPDKGVQYKVAYSVKQGCWWCGRDKGKGENHYEWKGGISPINEHLRKHLVTWKKDSMKFNDFKCVITQIRFEDIHHLLSFESIAKEVFNSTKIPVNPVSEYEADVLKEIENKCIDLHYKYGFGICLCKSIHLLYHKIYGEGNNIPQQFLEFVQRLENGEFNTYLTENNLTLNINYDVLNKLLSQHNLKYEGQLNLNDKTININYRGDN